MLLLFVHSYSYPFPIADQWYVSLPIATAIHDGTLSFADLIRMSPAGHRTLFTNLHTVVTAFVTGWDLTIEVWINPILALVNLLLLVLLFKQHSPRLVHWFLVPLSMFVFSICQLNWLVSFESCAHFVNLFLIASILVLVGGRPGALRLGLSAFLAVCSTYSMAHGSFIWPLGFVLMWVRGYRRGWNYVFWVLLATLALFGYVAGSGIQVGSAETGWTTVDLSDPLRVVRVLVAAMGAPLSMENFALATAAGIVGGALLLVNASYLWSRAVDEDGRSAVASWLALASFAVGATLLAIVSRLHILGDEVALVRRYATATIMFWIALAAFIVVATARISGDTRSRRWHKILRGFNLGAAVAIVPFYLHANIQEIGDWSSYQGNRLGRADSERLRSAEECLLRYPAARDASCLGSQIQRYAKPDERIYRLAVYRLSVFGDAQPTRAMPPSYRSGSPVIVISDSRWTNLWVRDWMLTDISADLIFHVAGTKSEFPAEAFRRPLTNVARDLSAESLARMEALAAKHGSIWVISSRAPTQTMAVVQAIEARGFKRAGTPDDGCDRFGRFKICQFARRRPPAARS